MHRKSHNPILPNHCSTDESTAEAIAGLVISIGILIGILSGAALIAIPIMILCKYFGL